MSSPITLERLTRELEKLKSDMDAGTMEHGEYDQRLARVIQELRERGLDADRAQVDQALKAALDRGIITPGVRDHLLKRLGIS